MYLRLHYSGIVLAAVALLVGLCLGGLWPNTPLHATATDHAESFAIATGTLDQDMEAVFFLDFLEGKLRAACINYSSGKFNAYYERDILPDFGLEAGKAPKYVMVTGVADLRRMPAQGRLRPGNTVVYVAETGTGKLVAYGIPWDRSAANAGRTIKSSLMLLDVAQFRTVAVRGAGQ
jgi:hypothetical protein